jgi:uncharacterized OsmC-like protein
MEYEIHGNGSQAPTVDAALQQSEELICPVYAMLKDGTKITSSVRIIED